MKIINWAKQQIVALSVASSNVTNNLISQNGDVLVTNDSIEQDKNQGNLLDGLNKGILNTEVRDLRWRTYKVLKASENLKLKVHSMDQDGDFHFSSVKSTSDGILLKKVKLDSYDTYELEMVVDNSEIAIDGGETMGNNHLNLYGDVKTYVNKDGDEIAIHGEINSNELAATMKAERPIRIERQAHPRFYLEKFTTKMHVNKISDEEKLLEFYVSKYPEERNPTSRLFVRKMEKSLSLGFIGDDVFMMDEVGFISRNTLGSPDFLCYGYKIIGFDKVIEFDGHYVIKYKAKVIINGTDTLSDFIEDDLEKRYENKEVKKIRL